MATRPLPCRPDGDDTLTEIALQLGVTRDVDSLAVLVVTRMVSLLRADRALFALLDHTGAIHHVVHHGFTDWPGTPAPLPIAQSVLNEAIASRELVIESTHDASPFSARQSARSLALRFIFAMPVESRGEVVGVLYVDSRQAVIRQLEDVEGTLVALARLVGTAVENARLYEEAELRTLLLGQLVHDFSLPLSAVQLNADQLQSGRCSAADTVGIGVDISAASARMTEMIATTLDLCRAATEQFPLRQPTEVDVNSFLSQQLVLFEQVRMSAGLELSAELAPGLPTVASFPERLRSVVSNLLFNAVKFAPTGSVLRLRTERRSDAGPPRAPTAASTAASTTAAYLFRRAVNLRPAPNTEWIAVSVHNEGSPIPADIQADLFRPWTRGPAAPDSAPGKESLSAGLGLAIVEQCLRSLGGTVWVQSGPTIGTTFTFALPVHVARY